MKKRIKHFVLISLISLSFLHSQNKEDVKALTEIISILEDRYKIQFNYAQESVENIFLLPPENNQNLLKTLSYLEVKTGLVFTVMTNGIVLVSQKEEILVCGFIKDKDNLQPLIAATVQTKKSSIITDQNGYFQISVKRISEPITIRFLGYQTLITNVTKFSNLGCEALFLTPTFQSLSEVVISNYITTGINKISNGSYEIDFSKFDILPGLIETDVLQAIQNFPGIQSFNETVSNINIRGGAHDQNLILWDDIKMYQSGHFFGLISMYNPHITQFVSLKKNGSSVSSTDGVSGTIDMQTSKEVNSNFRGVIGANLTNLNGFVDVPINDKSSIQIAARKSISDFIETPTYKAFFNRISQNTEVENNQANILNSNESFDFYDVSFRWIYNVSNKDKIRLNFINVYNELIFDENATVNNQVESRTSNLSQYSIAGGINYERNWNKRLQTTLEIYETDYKLKSVNANVLESQRFLQENIVSETSTKLKVNYKINTNFQVLNGYHFVETKVTNLDDVDIPLFRDLVSEVLRTHGVFSEMGFRSLNKKTNFNLGIRFNYLSKFKKHLWEPRLSFNQKFLNHFTFEILGEFKHQNTSQVINFQNDFLGIEKRRWQLSNNEDIPVIQSKQMSTGISYSKRGWLVDFDAYYKTVDGITSQSQGFQNEFEFIKSVGSYTVSGFDVLFRKSLSHLNTWLSYSYMDNNYSFNQFFNESFPSNFDITHQITLGTAYKYKNLKISTGFNWYSGKPTTNPVIGNEIVNNDINYQPVNSDNLKNYMRLDVSAIYDFKLSNKTNASLGVSVWNVLDTENQINNFYRINENMVNNTIQNSLGITPNAVFKLTF